MRLKIAHVINSFGLGGVPQVAYQLLRSLPADTYDVFVYVLKNYHDNSDARQRLAQQFTELGATVRTPERDEKKFYVVSQIAHWLMNDQIDILHTHSYKPNIYGRLAGLLCRHKGIKMIAHYHNYYDNKWQEDDSLIYEQMLAQQTDHFLACSRSVAEHAASRIGIESSRVEVLLNGIDLGRFKARQSKSAIKAEFDIPENNKLVGVVGRISRQKAQDVFLEAAAKLVETHPDALFLLAGAPDEPEVLQQLKAQAKTLGIHHKVLFLGYIEDITKIYSILDILVMPSRWEGFGLALVEAMAMSLPIVTTDVGGILEVVVPNESALIVPPDNAEAVAEAIGRLLENPAIMTKFSNAGSNRARQFSHDRIGLQAHQCYQRLLS